MIQNIKDAYRYAPRTLVMSGIVLVAALSVIVWGIADQGWAAVRAVAIVVAIYVTVHFALRWATSRDEADDDDDDEL